MQSDVLLVVKVEMVKKSESAFSCEILTIIQQSTGSDLSLVPIYQSIWVTYYDTVLFTATILKWCASLPHFLASFGGNTTY